MIGTKTYVVDDVFNPGGIWYGFVSYTICAFIYIIYI